MVAQSLCGRGVEGTPTCDWLGGWSFTNGAQTADRDAPLTHRKWFPLWMRSHRRTGWPMTLTYVIQQAEWSDRTELYHTTEQSVTRVPGNNNNTTL